MRICIIANGYPTPQEPQWGCFEKDQAMALKKQGHEVTIIYVDGTLFKNKVGITHKIDNGISIYGISYFPFALFRLISSQIFGKVKYKLRDKLISYLLTVVFQYMLNKQGKPDILYAHYLYNIAYSVRLKDKFNVPLVGIEHWSEVNKSNISSSVQYLANIAYYNSDKLLSVSKSLSDSIFSKFGKKSFVINNMLGVEFLDDFVLTSNENFNFISVGNLKPIKGFDLLIKAFAKSQLSLKGCKLYIVGEGKQRNRLQKLIDNFKLNDTVFLTGKRSKSDIISLLKESKVFVLSSYSETFSVASIEAMAIGLPVIATKCGGPNEFITKDNGVFAEVGDVDSLSMAMLNMYNNYSKYDNKQIANNCKALYSPNKIAQQLTKIFKETIIETKHNN